MKYDLNAALVVCMCVCGFSIRGEGVVVDCALGDFEDLPSV